MAYTFKYGDRPLEGVTIQRAVGRGGFGEVYFALLDSGKQIAIKYLKDNADVELRGISHVLNLKSPHLIAIHDVKRSADGDPFVIMEYISGPSLREIMTAEGSAMPPGKAAFFAVNIAKGLRYLHERGIVHRDLKPANIFYDDGYVKIGDYGLSKHMSVSQHSGQTVSVGTVHYMAPEIGSGSYTKAIDVYALGVMLYEMLTGRLPFTGASMAEILMKHVRDLPDLSSVPEPFRKVISRALQKDPADRYQDVDQMIDDLMASGEITAGVASFDPNTLSQIPRDPESRDPDRTLTRGGRAPVMDVRDAGLPPIPPLPGEPRRGWLERFGWKRRAADGRPSPEKSPAPKAGTVKSDPNAPSSGAHIMAIVMIGLATSIVLGGLFGNSGDDRVLLGVISAMVLAGALVGPHIAHFYVLSRTFTRHAILDRMIYAASTLAVSFPAFIIAAEEFERGVTSALFAVVATLLLCDWGQRIDQGRRGRISGEKAFSSAIVALVMCAIFGGKGFIFYSAALGAAASMLTQMLSAIRPMSRAEDADKRLRKASDRYDRANDSDANEVHVYGVAIGSESTLESPPFVTPETPAAPAQSNPPAASRAPQRRLDQPSFVGRAANAGMSFSAKVLLMVGLVWAALFNAEMTVGDSRSTVEISGGRVKVINHGRVKVDQGFPRAAIAIPFIIGTVLLVQARRHDSTLHLLRGLLGGGVALLAAFLTVGPASETFRLLFSDRWEEIGNYFPVIAPFVLAFLAIALVFWPRRRANEIVI